MEFRRAGSSGLHLSEVAYGNFLTHGDKIDADRAKDCVRAAYDAGITTFDTADSYAAGAAETVLGHALAGIDRSSIEVCTKVFFPLGDARPNAQGLSRKHILESIDGSLRRLGTDYVDVYLAHRYDPQVPLDEVLQAFADVVRAGKALYVGVSEWPVEKIRQAVPLARELAIPLVANQVQYSMLWRNVEQDVATECADAGIGLWAWSPMAQGVLSGKYRPGQPAPDGSRGTDSGRGSQLIQMWMSDQVLEAVAKLGQVAAELDLTLAKLALAWVLGRPGVTGVIVGGSNPAQVAENVGAIGVTIPGEALTRIDEILAGVQRGPLP